MKKQKKAKRLIYLSIDGSNDGGPDLHTNDKHPLEILAQKQGLNHSRGSED